jgi:hypothetical protein
VGCSEKDGHKDNVLEWDVFLCYILDGMNMYFMLYYMLLELMLLELQ